MDYVVIFVVLAVIVLVVSGPLRSRRADEPGESAERAELEAARDAKYREIRDAELDFRTGKLSETDWRAIDRTLRGEAVAILRALDDLPTSEAGERSEEHDRFERD
jgi:flagellar biosynthesis/type III secretory pathway M-ring protein FliF/YscJ